jgi:hypothetical protein
MQFKYEDVSFFKKNGWGQLRCLPRDAPDKLIATADDPTLKLNNQKNGWKGVCVYHETNDNKWLAHGYLHLHTQGADSNTLLLAYYDNRGQHCDTTNEDISRVLKVAATVLEYPTTKGILIN